MKKGNKTNIIINSILSKLIINHTDLLSMGEIGHILEFVNYQTIPDRDLADNEDLHPLISWDKISKTKLIRIVARNLKVVQYIDLKKYNYTVSEAKFALRMHPTLLDHLNIDLENLSNDDAYSILMTGSDYICRKVNVQKFSFSSKQKHEIVKSNYFSDYIMQNLNLKNLKDYHVAKIIIETGANFLDFLNLNVLTAKKWIDILTERPEMIKYCDFEKFKKGDIYKSIELVCMFPKMDFDYLIKGRDYIKEISALGWEKLVTSKPNEYIDICACWKFNETNWKRIGEIHPHLLAYKL